jgi:hypothetical protein
MWLVVPRPRSRRTSQPGACSTRWCVITSRRSAPLPLRLLRFRSARAVLLHGPGCLSELRRPAHDGACGAPGRSRLSGGARATVGLEPAEPAALRARVGPRVVSGGPAFPFSGLGPCHARWRGYDLHAHVCPFVRGSAISRSILSLAPVCRKIPPRWPLAPVVASVPTKSPP